MPAGKGRYTVGARGTHGCKGYPVVGGEGKVHGCHPTRGAAIRQQAAIYASQNQQKFADALMDLAKAEDAVEMIQKSWSITENYPGCQGFAVVNSDGELRGCFDNRAGAESAIAAHDAAEASSEDMATNQMIQRSRVWIDSPLSFTKTLTND